MSNLWNTLTGGRKSQDHPQSSPAPAPSSSSSSSTSSSPEPSGYGLAETQGQGQGAESIFRGSSFADPAQLHPLAGLDKQTLEYIILDESALSDLPGTQSVIPSRGFADDLCYGTGVTYLAALGIGGAWGLQEGLRRSAGQPPKLRLNSVLNAVTRRGPFLGNSAGVIAIVYNCINSSIGLVRGKHDAANTVLAGALSGMVFKSTKGLRQMMISGGIVASMAGAWAIFRRTIISPAEPTKADSL